MKLAVFVIVSILVVSGAACSFNKETRPPMRCFRFGIHINHAQVGSSLCTIGFFPKEDAILMSIRRKENWMGQAGVIFSVLEFASVRDYAEFEGLDVDGIVPWHTNE